MKRFILTSLFLFLLNACFGLSYNCYQRNELTGSYQLKNIENIPEQYRFIYTMQNDKIIGYYYNSSIIKFIDVINGNRIIKSTYFSKEGNVLYEKEFFYGDNSEIKAFNYKQFDEHGDIVYEAKSFFSNKGEQIIYNSTGFMKNRNVEQKLIINNLLFGNYQPLVCKTTGIIIDEKNKIAQTFTVEENFSYEDDCVTAKISQNNKLHKIKRKYNEGKIEKTEEIIFNADEKQISSKQCILNDSILTQIIKTNSESVNKYNYTKFTDECYMLTYNDWDNSSVTKVVIQDEIVYIKNKILENLRYPINLFDSFNF